MTERRFANAAMLSIVEAYKGGCRLEPDPIVHSSIREPAGHRGRLWHFMSRALQCRRRHNDHGNVFRNEPLLGPSPSALERARQRPVAGAFSFSAFAPPVAVRGHSPNLTCACGYWFALGDHHPRDRGVDTGFPAVCSVDPKWRHLVAR